MRRSVKKEQEYFGYPRCSASSGSSGSYSVSGPSSNESSGTSSSAVSYLNIQPLQEQHLGFTMYESLNRFGVCVIDNFLKDETAKQLHSTVENMSSLEGLLHDPLMNTASKFGNTTSRYRDDYITWISGKVNGYESIDRLSECLHKVVKLFYRYSLTQNRKYNITHKSMVQASCFPPQSIGYRLHSDNPDQNGRLLTFVYHSNKGYDPETSGGNMRFFVNSKFVDIQPKYNRLVVYWSNTMLEVLPCHTSLYSLTTWYFGSIGDKDESEGDKTNDVTNHVNNEIQYHNF